MTDSIYKQLDMIDDNKSLIEDILNEVSKKTLQDFARIVQRELTDGYEAVVNTSTACVDVCKKDTKEIIAQVYPDHKTVEKDYKTLKKINSVDENKEIHVLLIGDIL